MIPGGVGGGLPPACRSAARRRIRRRRGAAARTRICRPRADLPDSGRNGTGVPLRSLDRPSLGGNGGGRRVAWRSGVTSAGRRRMDADADRPRCS